jgi:hypothetical protein
MEMRVGRNLPSRCGEMRREPRRQTVDKREEDKPTFCLSLQVGRRRRKSVALPDAHRSGRLFLVGSHARPVLQTFFFWPIIGGPTLTPTGAHPKG